jgi:signal transduction histidine kinase
VQQTIAALQRAEQDKNELLIHLNHALRTPLNTIIGYGELLQEEAKERGQEALLPYAQRIAGAAAHMLTMMKNVRDLIQHDIGQAELTLAPFDVNALVRDVTAIIQPALKARHNAFTVHCPDAVGTMRADRDRVCQSLICLILHACGATESGTIALDVARETVQDTPWLVFRVTDTSPGLTGEQVQQAFCGLAPALPLSHDRVWQGLALSRRVCRAMRGDITLASVPGGGSTFTMRLPADVRAAANAAHGPSPS